MLTNNEDVAALETMAAQLRGRRVVALTGAGISTESGIPDYRSPESLARPRRPLHGPEFIRSAALRRRYWARSMVGWERFRLARPGLSHAALAQLEARGVVTGVITQNVDRLHAAAGSRRVTELHGALAEVVCLECHAIEDRDALQARMRDLNPDWLDGPIPMAPDGDADLPEDMVASFRVPTCVQCEGVLKPRVVFFGHNVARPVVDEAYAKVDDADVLLVAGTSLAVFSGYRFLLRAVDRKIPIAIVNRGPVRGEERATLKIEASTGETLAALARALCDSPHDSDVVW
ncbi:NAD-dependent protein deacetylase [Pendulispora albinea]|uniref:protein acetyllysine N-acetyltransferase n=1 Tax=Pendulispora albinea TaxID=2741071 RepID=A0ABZ2M384_9BACT